MAYKITSQCIACGSYAAACPVGAICEGTPSYNIGDECLECGACEAVCP